MSAVVIPADINKVISDILRVEGASYTNHPNDRGGPTKYGITLATLRAWRGQPALAAAEVQALTEAEARRIYYDRYVIRPGFAGVYSISPLVGIEVIDSGVNAGPYRAAIWLQLGLNAFNRSFRTPPDYPELLVDGRIGRMTLDAMSKFFALRGKARAERVLFRALNCLQGSHYLSLGAANPSQEEFMLGWFDHRVS
jgi:lysozyme family protein